jgi:RNA polymerase sigma-70 factor (ECF subfamily)
LKKENKQPEQTDQFLRLLMAHQNKLYAYIFSMVPNFSDADDLMQEVTLALLHRFPTFQLGTNFMAWSRKVALYEILKFRKKQHRRPMPFSEETLQAIADYVEKDGVHTEQMLDVLHRCVSKLNLREQQLVVLRYEDGATTQSVAEKLGVSIYSIYRAIERVQSVLLRCVNRTLATTDKTT